jgi:hypothetical protein
MADSGGECNESKQEIVPMKRRTKMHKDTDNFLVTAMNPHQSDN